MFLFKNISMSFQRFLQNLLYIIDKYIYSGKKKKASRNIYRADYNDYEKEKI